jgi:hypothetical protein
MSPKPFLFRASQLVVEGVKQECLELAALHTVMGVTWHHITCL